jgi:hypothetical protein
MSGLFKSNKQSSAPQATVIADPWAGIRDQVMGVLSQQIGKPGPTYTGETVAGKTAAEEEAVRQMGDYAAAPNTGEAFGLAKDEIRKTFAGDYDPESNKYYQAVKATATRNQDQALKTAAQFAGNRRGFYSGARLKNQGNIITDTTNNLNTTAYGLAEKERNLRASLIPQALQIDETERLAPVEKAKNLQQYGSLDRILEQARLDAIREEWIAANREYPLNILQLGSGLGAKEPLYAVNSGGSSSSKSSSGSSALSILSLLSSFI